ncbi:hypothetical protein I3843_03G244900 [Carya illinoinensis]|nr:hypothetical protein I3843_03G244900 [Carya illinoinensis]
MTHIQNLWDERTRSRTDNSGLHSSNQFWPRHLLTLTKAHQRTVEQTKCVETNQREPNLVLKGQNKPLPNEELRNRSGERRALVARSHDGSCCVGDAETVCGGLRWNRMLDLLQTVVSCSMRLPYGDC